MRRAQLRGNILDMRPKVNALARLLRQWGPAGKPPLLQPVVWIGPILLPGGRSLACAPWQRLLSPPRRLNA